MTLSKIAAAVAPLKQESINFAVEFMKDRLAGHKARLEAKDWDINKVAPRASSWERPGSYKEDKAKRDLFESITKREHHVYIKNGVDKVIWNQEGHDRILKQVADHAGAAYDAFVMKLETKIGEHTEAELSGNHVWGYSILEITKPDGTIENWKTQMITNYSKFGMAFNQFPSRKVKGKV